MKKLKRPNFENESRKLTNRQNDVFTLILDGYVDCEIGGKLFITTGTVGKHRAKIIVNLEGKNMVHSVRLHFDNKALLLLKRTAIN